jgi:hypothetical protein
MIEKNRCDFFRVFNIFLVYVLCAHDTFPEFIFDVLHQINTKNGFLAATRINLLPLEQL